MKAGRRNVLRRVLHYTRGSLPYIIFSLILAVVTVAATLCLPVLAGNAVDLLIGAEQVDFPALFEEFRKMALLIFLSAAAQWGMTACSNRVTYKTVFQIRSEAFAHLQELPLRNIDARPSGDTVSRFIADVDTFADGLLLGFSQLFTGVLTILGTLLFMLRISLGSTVVVVLITPISLFVASFIARRTHSMFQKQSAARGAQTALINEIIPGQTVVKAFGREEQVMRRFDEINAEMQDSALKATFFSSLVNPATRFVNSLVYAGVAVFGALGTLVSGGMTIGQLTCFLSYANQYTKPFNEISGVVTELENAIVCAGRIFELIDAPIETPDDDDAVRLDHADGSVIIKDVSFRYDPEQPLIENFNLSVGRGKRVAIVGKTGCGKTTLINLLMRFYDVDAGSICVDGTDIRHITRHSLRRNYGMVLQDSWLKSGTIRENIAMAKPDATDEEIISAAKRAHADSFIRRLPRGYNTVVRENGAGLSEGQKQLLCIARAMLSLPPMLILDEATSSIDTLTEQKVQRAFAEMMVGRTSFVVAHRLSTIVNADIILVMRNGSIVEKGTHAELLRRNGYYAELYNSQFAH